MSRLIVSATRIRIGTRSLEVIAKVETRTRLMADGRRGKVEATNLIAVTHEALSGAVVQPEAEFGRITTPQCSTRCRTTQARQKSLTGFTE